MSSGIKAYNNLIEKTLLHRVAFVEDSNIVDDIYNIIMQMFQHLSDVTPDGIHVLGALASGKPQDFYYKI